MKVFVTGGSGFIGSVVVRKLVHAGHTVTCLLRAGSRTQRIDDLPVKRLSGDIRDAPIVKAGVQACDATIHLAGLSSWNDINSSALEEVVEGGTQQVLEAAVDSPSHRAVFVSTAIAINGSDKPQVFDENSEFTLRDPKLEYAHAKHRAEAICLSAFRKGLFVVIVNPAEVYGPSHPRIVTLPNGVMRALTWVTTRVGLTLPFNADVIPYATRYWFVDGAKAQREFGVQFRDARETLLPTIEWLRQAGHLA
jgi:dihydroflavonol-4-reductase